MLLISISSKKKLGILQQHIIPILLSKQRNLWNFSFWQISWGICCLEHHNCTMLYLFYLTNICIVFIMCQAIFSVRLFPIIDSSNPLKNFMSWVWLLFSFYWYRGENWGTHKKNEITYQVTHLISGRARTHTPELTLLTLALVVSISPVVIGLSLYSVTHKQPGHCFHLE